jgi:hypothetical protein
MFDELSASQYSNQGQEVAPSLEPALSDDLPESPKNPEGQIEQSYRRLLGSYHRNFQQIKGRSEILRQRFGPIYWDDELLKRLEEERHAIHVQHYVERNIRYNLSYWVEQVELWDVLDGKRDEEQRDYWSKAFAYSLEAIQQMAASHHISLYMSEAKVLNYAESIMPKVLQELMSGHPV